MNRITSSNAQSASDTDGLWQNALLVCPRSRPGPEDLHPPSPLPRGPQSTTITRTSTGNDDDDDDDDDMTDDAPPRPRSVAKTAAALEAAAETAASPVSPFPSLGSLVFPIARGVRLDVAVSSRREPAPLNRAMDSSLQTINAVSGVDTLQTEPETEDSTSDVSPEDSRDTETPHNVRRGSTSQQGSETPCEDRPAWLYRERRSYCSTERLGIPMPRPRFHNVSDMFGHYDDIMTTTTVSDFIERGDRLRPALVSREFSPEYREDDVVIDVEESAEVPDHIRRSPSRRGVLQKLLGKLTLRSASQKQAKGCPRTARCTRKVRSGDSRVRSRTSRATSPESELLSASRLDDEEKVHFAGWDESMRYRERSDDLSWTEVVGGDVVRLETPAKLLELQRTELRGKTPSLERSTINMNLHSPGAPDANKVAAAISVSSKEGIGTTPNIYDSGSVPQPGHNQYNLQSDKTPIGREVRKVLKAVHGEASPSPESTSGRPQEQVGQHQEPVTDGRSEQAIQDPVGETSPESTSREPRREIPIKSARPRLNLMAGSSTYNPEAASSPSFFTFPPRSGESVLFPHRKSTAPGEDQPVVITVKDPPAPASGGQDPTFHLGAYSRPRKSSLHLEGQFLPSDGEKQGLHEFSIEVVGNPHDTMPRLSMPDIDYPPRGMGTAFNLFSDSRYDGANASMASVLRLCGDVRELPRPSTQRFQVAVTSHASTAECAYRRPETPEQTAVHLHKETDKEQVQKPATPSVVNSERAAPTPREPPQPQGPSQMTAQTRPEEQVHPAPDSPATFARPDAPEPEKPTKEPIQAAAAVSPTMSAEKVTHEARVPAKPQESSDGSLRPEPAPHKQQDHIAATSQASATDQSAHIRQPSSQQDGAGGSPARPDVEGLHDDPTTAGDHVAPLTAQSKELDHRSIHSQPPPPDQYGSESAIPVQKRVPNEEQFRLASDKMPVETKVPKKPLSLDASIPAEKKVPSENVGLFGFGTEAFFRTQVEGEVPKQPFTLEVTATLEKEVPNEAQLEHPDASLAQIIVEKQIRKQAYSLEMVVPAGHQVLNQEQFKFTPAELAQKAHVDENVAPYLHSPRQPSYGTGISIPAAPSEFRFAVPSAQRHVQYNEGLNTTFSEHYLQEPSEGSFYAARSNPAPQSSTEKISSVRLSPRGEPFQVYRVDREFLSYSNLSNDTRRPRSNTSEGSDKWTADDEDSSEPTTASLKHECYYSVPPETVTSRRGTTFRSNDSFITGVQGSIPEDESLETDFYDPRSSITALACRSRQGYEKEPVFTSIPLAREDTRSDRNPQTGYEGKYQRRHHVVPSTTRDSEEHCRHSSTTSRESMVGRYTGSVSSLRPHVIDDGLLRSSSHLRQGSSPVRTVSQEYRVQVAGTPGRAGSKRELRFEDTRRVRDSDTEVSRSLYGKYRPPERAQRSAPFLKQEKVEMLSSKTARGSYPTFDVQAVRYSQIEISLHGSPESCSKYVRPSVTKEFCPQRHSNAEIFESMDRALSSPGHKRSHTMLPTGAQAATVNMCSLLHLDSSHRIRPLKKVVVQSAEGTPEEYILAEISTSAGESSTAQEPRVLSKEPKQRLQRASLMSRRGRPSPVRRTVLEEDTSDSYDKGVRDGLTAALLAAGDEIGASGRPKARLSLQYDVPTVARKSMGIPMTRISTFDSHVNLDGQNVSMVPQRPCRDSLWTACPPLPQSVPNFPVQQSAPPKSAKSPPLAILDKSQQPVTDFTWKKYAPLVQPEQQFALQQLATTPSRPRAPGDPDNTAQMTRQQLFNDFTRAKQQPPLQPQLQQFTLQQLAPNPAPAPGNLNVTAAPALYQQPVGNFTWRKQPPLLVPQQQQFAVQRIAPNPAHSPPLGNLGGNTALSMSTQPPIDFSWTTCPPPQRSGRKFTLQSPPQKLAYPTGPDVVNGPMVPQQPPTDFTWRRYAPPTQSEHRFTLQQSPPRKARPSLGRTAPTKSAKEVQTDERIGMKHATATSTDRGKPCTKAVNTEVPKMDRSTGTQDITFARKSTQADTALDSAPVETGIRGQSPFTVQEVVPPVYVTQGYTASPYQPVNTQSVSQPFALPYQPAYPQPALQQAYASNVYTVQAQPPVLLPPALPCASPPCILTPCRPSPCTARPCPSSPCTPRLCLPAPCQSAPCSPRPCQSSPRFAPPCPSRPCPPPLCAARPCHDQEHLSDSCKQCRSQRSYCSSRLTCSDRSKSAVGKPPLLEGTYTVGYLVSPSSEELSPVLLPVSALPAQDSSKETPQGPKRTPPQPVRKTAKSVQVCSEEIRSPSPISRGTDANTENRRFEPKKKEKEVQIVLPISSSTFQSMETQTPSEASALPRTHTCHKRKKRSKRHYTGDDEEMRDETESVTQSTAATTATGFSWQTARRSGVSTRYSATSVYDSAASDGGVLKTRIRVGTPSARKRTIATRTYASKSASYDTALSSAPSTASGRDRRLTSAGQLKVDPRWEDLRVEYGQETAVITLQSPEKRYGIPEVLGPSLTLANRRESPRSKAVYDAYSLGYKQDSQESLEGSPKPEKRKCHQGKKSVPLGDGIPYDDEEETRDNEFISSPVQQDGRNSVQSLTRQPTHMRAREAQGTAPGPTLPGTDVFSDQCDPPIMYPSRSRTPQTDSGQSARQSPKRSPDTSQLQKFVHSVQHMITGHSIQEDERHQVPQELERRTSEIIGDQTQARQVVPNDKQMTDSDDGLWITRTMFERKRSPKSSSKSPESGSGTPSLIRQRKQTFPFDAVLGFEDRTEQQMPAKNEGPEVARVQKDMLQRPIRQGTPNHESETRSKAPDPPLDVAEGDAAFPCDDGSKQKYSVKEDRFMASPVLEPAPRQTTATYETGTERKTADAPQKWEGGRDFLPSTSDQRATPVVPPTPPKTPHKSPLPSREGTPESFNILEQMELQVPYIPLEGTWQDTGNQIQKDPIRTQPGDNDDHLWVIRIMEETKRSSKSSSKSPLSGSRPHSVAKQRTETLQPGVPVQPATGEASPKRQPTPTYDTKTEAPDLPVTIVSPPTPTPSPPRTPQGSPGQSAHQSPNRSPERSTHSSPQQVLSSRSPKSGSASPLAIKPRKASLTSHVALHCDDDGFRTVPVQKAAPGQATLAEYAPPSPPRTPQKSPGQSGRSSPRRIPQESHVRSGTTEPGSQEKGGTQTPFMPAVKTWQDAGYPVQGSLIDNQPIDGYDPLFMIRVMEEKKRSSRSSSRSGSGSPSGTKHRRVVRDDASAKRESPTQISMPIPAQQNGYKVTQMPLPGMMFTYVRDGENRTLELSSDQATRRQPQDAHTAPRPTLTEATTAYGYGQAMVTDQDRRQSVKDGSVAMPAQQSQYIPAAESVATDGGKDLSSKMGREKSSPSSSPRRGNWRDSMTSKLEEGTVLTDSLNGPKEPGSGSSIFRRFLDWMKPCAGDPEEALAAGVLRKPPPPAPLVLPTPPRSPQKTKQPSPQKSKQPSPSRSPQRSTQPSPQRPDLSTVRRLSIEGSPPRSIQRSPEPTQSRQGSVPQTSVRECLYESTQPNPEPIPQLSVQESPHRSLQPSPEPLQQHPGQSPTEQLGIHESPHRSLQASPDLQYQPEWGAWQDVVNEMHGGQVTVDDDDDDDHQWVVRITEQTRRSSRSPTKSSSAGSLRGDRSQKTKGKRSASKSASVVRDSSSNWKIHFGSGKAQIISPKRSPSLTSSQFDEYGNPKWIVRLREGRETPKRSSESSSRTSRHTDPYGSPDWAVRIVEGRARASESSRTPAGTAKSKSSTFTSQEVDEDGYPRWVGRVVQRTDYGPGASETESPIPSVASEELRAYGVPSWIVRYNRERKRRRRVSRPPSRDTLSKETAARPPPRENLGPPLRCDDQYGDPEWAIRYSKATKRRRGASSTPSSYTHSRESVALPFSTGASAQALHDAESAARAPPVSSVTEVAPAPQTPPKIGKRRDSLLPIPPSGPSRKRAVSPSSAPSGPSIEEIGEKKPKSIFTQPSGSPKHPKKAAKTPAVELPETKATVKPPPGTPPGFIPSLSDVSQGGYPARGTPRRRSPGTSAPEKPDDKGLKSGTPPVVSKGDKPPETPKAKSSKLLRSSPAAHLHFGPPSVHAIPARSKASQEGTETGPTVGTSSSGGETPEKTSSVSVASDRVGKAKEADKGPGKLKSLLKKPSRGKEGLWDDHSKKPSLLKKGGKPATLKGKEPSVVTAAHATQAPKGQKRPDAGEPLARKESIMSFRCPSRQEVVGYFILTAVLVAGLLLLVSVPKMRFYTAPNV